MRRREFIGLAGAAAAWPFAARAQQATPVVGWLGRTRRQLPDVTGFAEGLKSEGYVDGQNLRIQFRWADGQDDRLPGFAAEFARQRVDLILAQTSSSAHAAKAATDSIPTVFMTGGDPVQLGFVASMNRPGGNRTGMSLVTHTLNAKRLELLRELVPGAATIAVLLNPRNPSAPTNEADIKQAARALGLQIRIANVVNEHEITLAFAEFARERPDVLVVGADSVLNNLHEIIIKLAAEHRIPAAYEWREHTEAGGLISYGTKLSDAYRQLGVYSGRILKGARPSDLPVLQPTKFELAINQKTARALGLTVPPSLLARADEVIE